MSTVPPPSDVQPPLESPDPPIDTDPGGTNLTRDDVTHLAHLARLELTDQELDTYVGQLSVILESVASVSTVTAQAGEIEPTSHAVPLTNVFRDDVVRPGLSHEAALAAAPASFEGRFRVPQILGEEQ